jgi:hypothetical protein
LFELSRKSIVISKGRREPLPKFPERKSDLKTLPKILEDILVKIRTNYMYGKRAGSPARKSDLNGGINTLW